MSETITKLTPNRDLQCYFQTPSAVAALSSTSATGFTVSGCWRQQFDWAVVEWNRDNVFEHPQLRNLPDGDLSGIVLSYQEQRVNCIQADSTLFPTVDWPSLRIWATDTGSIEQIYVVPLVLANATPVPGSYPSASATFTLTGSITPGDLIELAWEEEHYNYTTVLGDTLGTAATNLATIINTFFASSAVTAVAVGTAITLIVNSDSVPAAAAYVGTNGNRLGAYGTVSQLGGIPGGTESWSPVAQQFSGGQSPSAWTFSITFKNLHGYLDGASQKDSNGWLPTVKIPTNNIRKMRWTYAADLQTAAYVRSEFSVTITNWSVTGTGLTYSVAGPGSRRIEDTSASLVYSHAADWSSGTGNFSGGSIQVTTTSLATCTYQFVAERVFDIYIGTRMAPNCVAKMTVSIDGVAAPAVNLALLLDDVLVRVAFGSVQPGSHTITIQHTGVAGTYLYFDFIDLVVPSQQLPTFANSRTTTLATDWDTEHSLALAPERTAWFIDKLGFTGRANHYTGALWFYELVRVGHVYATGTVQFGGSADANKITTLSIGTAGSPLSNNEIDHLHLAGDTIDTIATAFALVINSGYTSVWASASGSTLTIQSRLMGTDGKSITIAVTTNSVTMTTVASSSQLTGGVDGDTGGVSDLLASVDPNNFLSYSLTNVGWRTDLTATPRINRACRDWSRSFFQALNGYGIEATAAFSTELQHGDPALTAGIAQRYPNSAPVTVTTPALQTNFSPTSLTFWQQVYADMAQVMSEAGQTPYLQFGEVQWWYFPYDSYLPPFQNQSGLPFYDAYTQAQFLAKYGRAMATIADNTVDPTQPQYQQEAAFLPTLIGAFTAAIQQYVRQSHPTARFEVLYPRDTNNGFTSVVNFPLSDWTASTLDCLKTENFGFTGGNNLVLAGEAINFPISLGFPKSKASHLVGISGATTPWGREANMAAATGLESVVLFALDQYCLIGYQPPSLTRLGRSFMIP